MYRLIRHHVGLELVFTSDNQGLLYQAEKCWSSSSNWLDARGVRTMRMEKISTNTPWGLFGQKYVIAGILQSDAHVFFPALVEAPALQHYGTWFHWLIDAFIWPRTTDERDLTPGSMFVLKQQSRKTGTGTASTYTDTVTGRQLMLARRSLCYCYLGAT